MFIERKSIDIFQKSVGLPKSSMETYNALGSKPLTVNDNNVFIDGVIVSSDEAAFWSGWGMDFNFVTPENVRAALQDLDSDITLWINSPGGCVFSAGAIGAAMKKYQENHKINVVVDGLCASAATYLAIQGDERKINRMSQFMIHNCWGIEVGDRQAMQKAILQMENIDSSYAEEMASRSKLSVAEIRAAMDKETWYSSQEAVKVGFMDHIYEPKKKGITNVAANAATMVLSDLALQQGY